MHAITLKAKLYFSLSFLLLVIALTAGGGAYYLYRLGEEAKAIMQDNYRTMNYMSGMSARMDKMLIGLTDTSGRAKAQVDDLFYQTDSIAKLQQANITEPGESELSHELRKSLAAFQADFSKWLAQPDREPFSNSLRLQWQHIKDQCRHIYNLNEETVLRRSEKAEKTADSVLLYMLLLGAGSVLVGLLFLFILPAYITKPVKILKEGIKEIGHRNYKYKLVVNTADEFGKLAAAFNTMAAKLDEYEHSNLAEAIKARQRTEAVIDHMNEAVICLDENLRILFLNQHALDVLSIKDQEITGMHSSELANKNKLFNSLYSEIMVGSYADAEIKAVNTKINGTEKLFSREIISMTTKPTGEDRIVHFGFIIVLHDVTELLAKDKAKTMFIATLSHELKTPLASIEMSTSLLENGRLGSLNTEQRDLIHTIRHNYERIQRMATEMLEISKIETSHLKVDIIPCDPLELVERAVSGVEMQLHEKRIDLEKAFPQQMPEILADPQKTLWVLNNLLTNAIRYAPQSSALHLKIQVLDTTLLISVRDQGPGINKADQQHIFEKFYRLEHSDNSGTGLGLAISKEFVEKMGGSIGVNSEPGQGAEFWIKIPLRNQR